MTIEAPAVDRDRAADGEPIAIRTCCGSRCAAQGALEVMGALQRAADAEEVRDQLVVAPGSIGCCGLCGQGPVIHLPAADTLYCRVGVDDVEEIVVRAIGGQPPVERLLYTDPTTGRRSRGVGDNPFFVGQRRRLLARCGALDPASIDEALDLGAYRGLRRAVSELEPDRIIDMVKRSGLRERGAQGFPVGLKWSIVAESPSQVRYVVANGEGGDPASGIDRVLLEGDPHRVIEGLVIAGFAVGASKGFVIIRSEHQAAAVGFERAITQANERGFVGSAIFGTSFDFDIEIHETAGASVGGEETALLNVLQGRRAVARPRPPFPSVSGLWQRPTLINSLETLANIPSIIAPIEGDGVDVVETKIVTLSGTVNRAGLAEVALGTPVGDIVHAIGGGCRGDRSATAIHVGGPGGATIGIDLFDTPFDYDSLRGLGLDLGSGSLVVLDDSTCVLSFARYLVELSARESCGTCPPCRIGTRVLLNLLDRVGSGAGDRSDLARIERLCQHISRTSMCELGRTAVNPVISGLRHFRFEYEAHAEGMGCGAESCSTRPRADGGGCGDVESPELVRLRPSRLRSK